MTNKPTPFRSLLAWLLVSSCLFTVTSCLVKVQDHQFPSPKTLAAVQGPPVAAGLLYPIGITEDPKGHLWVTEAGSGTVNNGQVSVITPTGKFPVITGFVSAMSPENSPEGLNHLAYKDGKLYILHGVEDKLYIVDVSAFVPGSSAPIAAGSLTGIDIGTYVKGQHPNAPDSPDSNPYNLTFGPNGDLFITDAGANAIVRLEKASNFMTMSIFATFPDVTNPIFDPTQPQNGPPTIDAVPTGIVYNGTDFLVTTLVGYPFPANKASIYKVNAMGTATVHKTNFSGLTDIALTPGGKALVTEFGFSTTPRIANGDVNGDDAGSTVLGLGTPPYVTPVDILVSNTADTYYVLFYGPGMIVKLSATE
ncbi:ScyD/ScyE family protein [Larkinella sp. VNQ87]|uniref:ScyD/ScyE family protein n=1 Tax=Larkinella sp. VNQ87 TaxID=3400921 RepID=UPI003C0FFA32